MNIGTLWNAVEGVSFSNSNQQWLFPFHSVNYVVIITMDTHIV